MMTLKRRIRRIERAVKPHDPGFIVLFRDDAGVLRDAEGNIMTDANRPPGRAIVFDERIRDC
jgi:hypothetical protein